MIADKFARRLAIGAASIMALLLGGCLDRLDHLGKPPSMSAIDLPPEATVERAIPDEPLPEPSEATQSASLWQPGARTFFKDQRASRVGDILTVTIDIDESARLSNTTSRSRDNSETAGLPHLLGFESTAAMLLPGAFDPSQLIDLSSESESAGAGKVNRQERIAMQVAAVIIDQLPNGNFVIRARQQVRVNFELRELIVEGIIRPEDISPDNAVTHEQIAEARISYGGRGQITDVQQPRYGQQVLDMILPF